MKKLLSVLLIIVSFVSCANKIQDDEALFWLGEASFDIYGGQGRKFNPDIYEIVSAEQIDAYCPIMYHTDMDKFLDWYTDNEDNMRNIYDNQDPKLYKKMFNCKFNNCKAYIISYKFISSDDVKAIIVFTKNGTYHSTYPTIPCVGRIDERKFKSLGQ